MRLLTIANPIALLKILKQSIMEILTNYKPFKFFFFNYLM